MLEFQYKELRSSTYRVTLKTDLTEPGTLHKMVKAMFFLGWVIVSGKITTIREEGKDYSIDEFILTSDEAESARKASKLGVLMSSVFSEQSELDSMIEESNLVEPKIFESLGKDSELVFSDVADGKSTCFYLESRDRRGLLYFVTKVLFENSVSIVEGELLTDESSGRAKDTFYLVDSEGKGFANTELADRLIKSLRRQT